MTKQDIEKLMNAVEENEDFAERMSNICSAEDLVTLAREADVLVTVEEAEATMAELVKRQEKEELDEEELEMVSGGFLTEALIVLGVIGVATVLSVIALRNLQRQKERYKKSRRFGN